jgi:hypothetical protein
MYEGERSFPGSGHSRDGELRALKKELSLYDKKEIF